MTVVGLRALACYGVADGVRRLKDGLGIVDLNHTCGGADVIQTAIG